MTAHDWSGHVGNHEPVDPTPLRSRVVDSETFNRIAERALVAGKNVEFGESTAILVFGNVMYITDLDCEVA